MSPDREDTTPGRLRSYLLFRDRTREENLRFVLDTVATEGGTALFHTHWRGGRRRLRWIKAHLPIGMAGLITSSDPISDHPAARRKYRRFQYNLLVRPADQVPDETLTDPVEMIEEWGTQLAAERRRLRVEHPGWDQDTTGPQD
jgi:hypothetical protein